VSSVGSSAARNSALDNDVVDEAGVNIELLGLGVSSQVDKELLNSLEGLLGPSTLSVLEDLGLGLTGDTTRVASERNNLLVVKTVVHVADSGLKLETLAGTSDVVSVLVVSSQVRDSALSGYGKKSKMRGCHDKREKKEQRKANGFDDLHLAASAGCLEYLTIANLYLFINNNS
jgi:hypothetical protein